MHEFFLLGAVQALFLSVVFWFNKKVNVADRFLNVWLLFIGINLFSVYGGVQGWYRVYPQFFSLTTSLLLLEGPFLYLYVLLATNTIAKLKLYHIAHAIPFLFFTGYFVFRIHTPTVPDLYQHIRSIMADPSNVMVLTFGLFNHFHLIGYLIASIFVFRKHAKQLAESYSYTEGVNLAWLRSIILAITGISVIILLGLIASDVLFFISHDVKADLIYATIAILPYYLSFFAIRQKIIYPFPAAEEADAKYEASGLSKTDSKALADALTQLMQTQKIYLNPKLTLKDIADALHLHPKRLSQVINENFNQNFFNYVNAYRVAEFKERVGDKKNDHYTLLSIGLDCGFSTKSSFNSTFKKLCGVTPSEYKAGLTTGNS